jgi:uncharacterized iron-regulated protein
MPGIWWRGEGLARQYGRARVTHPRARRPSDPIDVPALLHYDPRMRFLRLLPLALVLAACARGTTALPATPATPAGAHRIVATTSGATVSLRALGDAMQSADVVFLGEQHDDPATHALQLAVLDEAATRGRPVALSLEMFERDVQQPLDEYLTGRLAEQDFLAGARPWERYATDYRPSVLYARSRGWPVLASNVPRRLASLVSRGGLAALETLPPGDRALVARDLRCPKDRYYERFIATVGSHGPAPAQPAAGGAAPPPAPPADSASRAMADRFYAAQCVKDETMAESIVRAAAGLPSGTLVVHYTGAFHSDYRQGTVERVVRRETSLRPLVISFVPVPDPAAADPATVRERGDYVVFTTRAPRPATAPTR